MSKDKSATKAPSKKLTKAQTDRLQALYAKLPPIEKLDPEMYGKLQSTIHEIVEKTLPEYKQWVNSAFGQKVLADDCGDCNPEPLCSSCGNDCPTQMCYSCGKGPTPIKCGGESVQNIDQIVVSAVDKAMTAAIRQALAETAILEGSP